MCYKYHLNRKWKDSKDISVPGNRGSQFRQCSQPHQFSPTPSLHYGPTRIWTNVFGFRTRDSYHLRKFFTEFLRHKIIWKTFTLKTQYGLTCDFSQNLLQKNKCTLLVVLTNSNILLVYDLQSPLLYQHKGFLI